MTVSPSIVWFRIDLRLADNPALQAAMKRGGPVVPVFIHAPEEESPWEPGGASCWWLHHSAKALDAELRATGSQLVIRRGPSLATLRSLAKETGAGAVFWNRRYEPALITRDQIIKEALRNNALEVESFNGALLNEPWTIQNQSGKPFQVFTPFWRHCLARPAPADPLPTPRKIEIPALWPKPLPLDVLRLEPKLNWAEGMRATWQPGAAGAQARLKRFLNEAVVNYDADRNCPGLVGTSRLSPHLHFGEISPRQIWHAVAAEVRRRNKNAGPAVRLPASAATDWHSSPFLTELGWREFAHHLLYHFPRTPTEPLRADFKKFPWRNEGTWLKAWQKGTTGYPIVDAGMRELWATGWMHNRVRMIVASFLVKDLLVSWQEGARWFWDTLVDADLAQNTLGWQWTAGCGADAAPYFRVFNPISQGEKFDPHGAYTRKWCPELAKLPDNWVHRPWEAPAEVLARAGIELNCTYPRPMVSHTVAREIALEAFASIKSALPGRSAPAT